jgi:hypothetical protein
VESSSAWVAPPLEAEFKVNVQSLAVIVESPWVLIAPPPTPAVFEIIVHRVAMMIALASV